MLDYTLGWMIVIHPVAGLPPRCSFGHHLSLQALSSRQTGARAVPYKDCLPAPLGMFEKRGTSLGWFLKSSRPLLADPFFAACHSEGRKYGWTVPRETFCPPRFIGPHLLRRP